MRPEEVQGQHYYFISEAEFSQLIDDQEFIEWAFVHGKAHYGSTFSELQRIVLSGKKAIFNIDVQ
jgi:guanylate kinase